MSFNALLGPVFVQVALTLGLLCWTGILRIQAVRSSATKLHEVALDQPGWPEQATKVANAYRDQLHFSILFYVLIAFVLLVAPGTRGLVLLSWLFVLTRALHALVQVTTNNVPRRFVIFVAGAVILAVMWLIFAATVLFGM